MHICSMALNTLLGGIILAMYRNSCALFDFVHMTIVSRTGIRDIIPNTEFCGRGHLN